MSFFLLKRSTKGRLRVHRSATASLRICEVFWPETKRVVLGFSFCCGSRLAMARFARAFLGFLVGVLDENTHEWPGSVGKHTPDAAWLGSTKDSGDARGMASKSWRDIDHFF